MREPPGSRMQNKDKVKRTQWREAVLCSGLSHHLHDGGCATEHTCPAGPGLPSSSTSPACRLLHLALYLHPKMCVHTGITFLLGTPVITHRSPVRCHMRVIYLKATLEYKYFDLKYFEPSPGNLLAGSDINH
ncbi:uncharacterized protein FYN16_003646 isoform 2-T2 [Cariama cristata]